MTSPPNKGAIIRSFPLDAPTSEIIARGREHGLTIAINQIYAVRGLMRQEQAVVLRDRHAAGSLEGEELFVALTQLGAPAEDLSDIFDARILSRLAEHQASRSAAAVLSRALKKPKDLLD